MLQATVIPDPEIPLADQIAEKMRLLESEELKAAIAPLVKCFT